MLGTPAPFPRGIESGVFAKAQRSRISFIRPDRHRRGEKEASSNSASCIARFLKAASAVPCISQLPAGATPDFVVTTIASAELIKHASNSFLALKSLRHVLADLCERLGGNVDEVTRAWASILVWRPILEGRVGFWRLLPAEGFQAFIKLADRAGIDFGLLKGRNASTGSAWTSWWTR